MKKQSLILLFFVIVFCSFKPSAPVVWKLDAAHSNLGFSVLHFGISDITGTVKLNNATITGPDSLSISGATVSLEADMNTIDTDNDKRDAHLKTADFFDTGKFPALTFQSTSMKKMTGETYQLNGNLTMHGVTKPVVLTVSVKSALNPMSNKPIMGCRVTGTIKRTNFGISTSTPEGVLADDVAITGNLEFNRE